MCLIITQARPVREAGPPLLTDYHFARKAGLPERQAEIANPQTASPEKLSKETLMRTGC